MNIRQRVLRELCMSEGMISQKQIAQKTGCSISYVNKLVKLLKKKKYIHQPFRNRISVLNFQSLLLYWAFTREWEKEKIIKIKTNYSVEDLEKKISKVFKKFSFTCFTAAKKYGVAYVPYNDVFLYAEKKESEKIKKMEEGNKSVLNIIVSDDGHLFSRSMKNLAPLCQVFVDLIGLNTWEAKCVANRLSSINEKYPVFGTKIELGEIL